MDFFIAVKLIFSSLRSQCFHRREVDFFIAAKSTFSSPRSRFFHRRAVDFFIAAKLIFSSPRYRFFFASRQELISFCLTAIHTSRQCFRGFALSGSRFACRPALFKMLSSVNARGCHFPGSKPVDCCLIAVFELL